MSSEYARQPAAEASDDVPARLIATAIDLYGERGCHAVSAREIIREAGVLNDAAIRYYFGNKQDLLKACVHDIALRFTPIMTRHWEELEALKSTSEVTVQDVIATVLGGMLALYQQHRSAVKLLARMIREEGAEGQAMHLQEMGATLWRLEAELADILPDMPARTLRLNATLAIYNIINGLVDQDLLSTLPGIEEGEQYYTLSAAELMQGFVDFVSAGVSGGVAIRRIGT